MPVLPGLVALAGVVGVALYLEGIRSRVASLETDQTSICSAVCIFLIEYAFCGI